MIWFFIFVLVAALGAASDTVWGGQYKLLRKHKRIIAVVLMFLALSPLGFDKAIIGLIGYFLVRVLGWRFLGMQDKLFLTMEKPIHALYAYIHGLLFLSVPAIAYFALHKPWADGVIYWLGVNAVITFSFWAIMRSGHKRNEDYTALKESTYGGLYAVSCFMYLMHC